METLAVIPARSGSKGIKNKNMMPFKGKRLLYWTTAAAIGADLIDRVIVSTDDDKIAEYARHNDAETPFLRPKELAGDNVHSVHVVIHALEWLRDNENYAPEIVLMLLPTNPLMTADDADCALTTMLENDAPAVISVCKASPLFSYRYIISGKLIQAVKRMNPNFQRQSVQQLYVVNGAIFGSRVESLFKEVTFHQDGAVPYIMPYERSVDINTVEDAKIAERLS